MTNEERMERIEKELKQARKINHGLFALMIGALAIVALGAAKETEKTEELRARKFILEDAGGRERGVFAVKDQGVEFNLLGTDKKPQVSLYADDSGQGLRLADATGRERVELRAEGNSARLFLSDADGKEHVQLETRNDQPGLVMVDANGRERIGLKVEGATPVLSLTDMNGKQRIRLGMRDDFPNLTLAGAGGEPFWAAIPDKY